MESNRIYGKLMEIQRELKAPKGQYNDFGKYNYRSCEDILEAVKPLCLKHNAALTLSDEICQIGGRIYVVAHAKIVDCETGNSIETQAFAREQDNKKGMYESQITGMASSYARKYALNGLFCIDDTKDADALPNENTNKATENPPKTILCENCGKAMRCKEDGRRFGGKYLCNDCIKAGNAK